MNGMIGSTLFVKKNVAELQVGGLPMPDLYNSEYILTHGKFLSTKQLNDLFSIHMVTNQSWEELVKDYIK